MRVAVCLSGQMRSFRECYPGIYSHIIEPNKADVFIHTWYDEDQLELIAYDTRRTNTTFKKGDDKELIALYKPVAYHIEKPISFKNPSIQLPESYISRTKGSIHKECSLQEVKDHAIHSTYSMFYSIYKCNEIKEKYAYANNLKYDVVIRLRYDLCVTEHLVCEKYPTMECIYYADLKQPDQLISDWINMGSTSIMNIYASIFLHIEYLSVYTYFKKEHRKENTIYSTEECNWGNEYMIRDIMDLFKIPKDILKERYSLRY